jgi:DNA-binding MarR family transcriptional regulator
VQCLQFIQEFPETARFKQGADIARVSFFLRKAGGMHLLLLLLNAYYQKPRAGRTGGWPFGVLLRRIRVSERTLRTLLTEAVQDGLILRERNPKDKRWNIYYLHPDVVASWEALITQLESSISDVSEFFGADALADVDYHNWDPERSARQQIPIPSVYLSYRSGKPRTDK